MQIKQVRNLKGTISGGSLVSINYVAPDGVYKKHTVVVAGPNPDTRNVVRVDKFDTEEEALACCSELRASDEITTNTNYYG